MRRTMAWIVLAAAVGCGGKPSAPAPASKAPAEEAPPPVISAEKLKADIWGLTPAEVRAKTGAPHDIETSATAFPGHEGASVWRYKAGNGFRLVVFGDGKVSDVR